MPQHALPQINRRDQYIGVHLIDEETLERHEECGGVRTVGLQSDVSVCVVDGGVTFVGIVAPTAGAAIVTQRGDVVSIRLATHAAVRATSPYPGVTVSHDARGAMVRVAVKVADRPATEAR